MVEVEATWHTQLKKLDNYFVMFGILRNQGHSSTSLSDKSCSGFLTII